MVHISHVFIELCADLIDSGVLSNFRKDFKLEEFDVDGFFVLDKEVFEGRVEVLFASSLDDVLYVGDYIVADFI